MGRDKSNLDCLWTADCAMIYREEANTLYLEEGSHKTLDYG